MKNPIGWTNQPKMHFDFRQLEWIPPTQEEVNDELDRYKNEDICEVLWIGNVFLKDTIGK